MELVNQGRPGKVRRVFKTLNVGPTTRMGIHNNSLRNLRRGLLERVFFVELDGQLQEPPRPLADAFHERVGDLRKRLLRVLPKAAPWNADQFCSTYVGRRKQVYECAAESLRAKAITKQDGYLRTFIKAEKVDFTVKGDPAPRVIQPRNPRYILETGRYLKQLEHPVFKGLAEVWGHRQDRRDRQQVVMKGLTPHEVGEQLHRKWTRYTKPVAVGLDASRFDQHVSAQALRFEHSIYLNLFRGADRAYLKYLLEMQIRNRGYATASDGTYKYAVDGCRGSGDINTSLGNCLLMSLLVRAYVESVGLDCDLANNGDDCVLFMESGDLHKLQGLKGWFREMGFTMKVEEPAYEFELIEFCQGHPVWTPEGWLMVRNLRTAIAKDAVTILDMRHHARAVWDAIGTGGLSVAGGVPIYDAYYRMYQRCGDKGRIDPTTDQWYSSSGFHRMSRGMNRQACDIHPQTRYSFWRAFGVTPDSQIAAEAIYNDMVLSTLVEKCVPERSTFPQLF